MFAWQDVVYQSLQAVVDWFREAVGIPMEKKYNSVLFGGRVYLISPSIYRGCHLYDIIIIYIKKLGLLV